METPFNDRGVSVTRNALSAAGQVFPLREILNVRVRIDEIYAEHTGKPTEEVRQDMERDRFFSAEQAAEYGLIDRVLDAH